MKICDLTQFYSPLSGGVKRYLHEKISYLQAHTADGHMLVVPGAQTDLTTAGRSRIYTIASPIVSRKTRYRALLNLRAVEEIIERERPDIIESADPYQLGWKAAAASRTYRIPAVAFYHSHFPEAYLRRPAGRLGLGDTVVRFSAAYVRHLYNRFQATIVPSPEVAETLKAWGVRNVRQLDLGVNTDVFRPTPDDAASTRVARMLPPDALLLLYVGRLAEEKNTGTLCEAFARLAAHRPGAWHLLVVGDGQQREQVQRLQRATDAVTWLPYCANGAELARLYRAADLFVHPGTQETFGLVALESQACGTPVVGIRGSSMDRIILHDQESWAAENSPAALADAIERSSRRDLRAMGLSAATAVAERYAWTRIFDRLFCIYRELCADYKRGAAG